MKRTLVRRVLVVVLAVTSARSFAVSFPYYVFDSGLVSANAGLELNFEGNDLGMGNTDNHSFFTAKAQQTLATGTGLANTSGTAYEVDTRSLIAQFAGSNIEDTAQIGALHSTISANTNSGAEAALFNAGNAAGTAHDTLGWGDTVAFHSNNPSGSFFTAAITLDVAIQPLGTFGLIESGSFFGRATASLDIHGNIDLSQVFHPVLFISDAASVSSDGTIFNNFAASPTASFEFFVPFQVEVDLTFDATLETQANATMGHGQVLVDAGNTAVFSLHTDDPEASYVAQSGTVFASDPPTVPEPGSLGLLGLGVVGLLRRRGRDCKFG